MAEHVKDVGPVSHTDEDTPAWHDMQEGIEIVGVGTIQVICKHARQTERTWELSRKLGIPKNFVPTPGMAGRISRVGTGGPLLPFSPPTMRIDPLESVIADGYQRGSCILS